MEFLMQTACSGGFFMEKIIQAQAGGKTEFMPVFIISRLLFSLMNRVWLSTCC
jgi:hypothetical protein